MENRKCIAGDNEKKEIRVAPLAKAYVRSGEWADKNWLQINRELKLDTNNEEVLLLKNGVENKNVTREILMSFDLSEVAKLDYKKVAINPSYTRIAEAKKGEAGLAASLYLVDPRGWREDTVTWNNMPECGECICENVPVGALAWPDVTDAVTKLLAAGETTLSFLMKLTVPSAVDSRINPKTAFLVASTEEEVGGCVRRLTEDEEENRAIWAYAEKLFDEWYERYQQILAEGESPVKKIESDPAHYTKLVKSGGSGFAREWTVDMMIKEHPTRTYDSMDDLGKYTDYNKEQKFDEYGGLMDESRREEATGFFYSKKIGDRWWIIDPLGYPCHIRAVSGVGICYLGSHNQRTAALARYGTEERWAAVTVDMLKNEFGFNLARTSAESVLGNPERMINQCSVGFAGEYGRRVGSNCSNGGSTRFSENNTMNVFDPDFVTFADERGKLAEKNKDDPWILGYTTDNELPMDVNMLYNYLSINGTKPMNRYSYAAAWTWLFRMTGKERPQQEDITRELVELFRGFVWDRYYNVVTTAFRRYDPNHMILGTRFLTGVKNAEWVLRFASRYLDCMTVNWYGQWEPKADDLYELCRHADLPLMVTEFYTKALDSGLANTRGAGWVVPTQQDRGDFYQCFTLRLLECKNFIGWHWFQYQDCDPAPETVYKEGTTVWRDQSSIDANKGLVDNAHRPYRELTDAMTKINKNVYRLIEHFDAKYKD